jgi:hypothetical protein
MISSVAVSSVAVSSVATSVSGCDLEDSGSIPNKSREFYLLRRFQTGCRDKAAGA